MLNTKDAVRKINGYLKGSTLNVIYIGLELQSVKDQTYESGDETGFTIFNQEARIDYRNMFDDLPFGEKVGNKFMAIANDRLIRKYADKCPSAYNTLYDLLRGRTEDEFKKLIELGLTSTSTRKDIEKYLETVNGKSAKKAPKKGNATASKKGSASKKKTAPKKGKVTTPETGGSDTKEENTSSDSDQSKKGDVASDNNDNAVTPLIKEIDVVKVVVDESSVTSEKTRQELFALQSEVQKLVDEMTNKSATVKTYDVPVLKVTAKVPEKKAA